jgi:NTP pyrophosphatase (non-canonical NTP hydrolase)
MTPNEKRLQAQVDALTDRCLTLAGERDREHARWRDVASRYNDLRETAMAAAHSGGPGFVLLGLDELQRQMAEWELKNFGGQPPHRMFMGMVEENGELAHALLKAEQNIRGSASEHEAKAKDAVGDLLVFAFNFCSSKGWSLERILLDTWAEVSQRDWTIDPNEGDAAKSEPAVRDARELDLADPIF